MHHPTESTLLRTVIGEPDRHERRSRFGAIVPKAPDTRVAGATVLRSPMGRGAGSRLHTPEIIRLSNDLPIIMGIGDEETNIDASLPILDPMTDGCLVTMQAVRVIHNRHENGKEAKP